MSRKRYNRKNQPLLYPVVPAWQEAEPETDSRQEAMDYRSEIDGLRALAVLPVILFHSGFETFSGGFVGVDVFFVISGYLITTIILTELEQERFSIVTFYERRARRILPALFLVILVCIPFAWFWLLPSDMKDFSQSLVAVSIFASNILFWRESGYFDTAAELKPLLHTWSLAVEEQYYVLFPLFLMLFWKLGKRWMLLTLGLVFVASLAIAQWAAYAKPAAAFYLLPTRGWELLIGTFSAFYLSQANRRDFGKVLSELGGWLGVTLILYAVFAYSKATPFPGLYALAPTLGAVLIILFATKQTSVGKFVGNKAFVGIGLISYSAYLWHQPLFALARHQSLIDPSATIFLLLSILALVLAYISWRYVEAPFRNKNIIKRKSIFLFASFGTIFFLVVGLIGNISGGFKFRFSEIKLPSQWNPPIKCHGAVAISAYENPIGECLGKASNKVAGDIFLLGDSHAAQITFPLKIVAMEGKKDFFFINTEDQKDFPYSFFKSDLLSEDRIFQHILRVADAGDFLIVSFHRGHFNESRDKHLPLDYIVKDNENYDFFIKNMVRQIKIFESARVRVVLVKDAPLLSDTSSIEKCAYLNVKSGDNGSQCSVKIDQDLHTRTRQSKAFDYLRTLFPKTVIVADPLTVLYGDNKLYNPINSDGTYRMFDRHHLTENESLKLVDMFRATIR
jgi:peptidoglycan/LPS O-acetylase OafA/YrhL